MKPTNKAARALLSKIFLGNKEKKNKKKEIERIPCRFLCFVPIAKSFISNFQSCKFILLLSRHCPISDIQLNAPDVQISDLVKKHSGPQQVVNFLKAVVLHIIPRSVWGSAHNLNVLISGMECIQSILMIGIARVVKLRRYEAICLHELMLGMRVLVTYSNSYY